MNWFVGLLEIAWFLWFVSMVGLFRFVSFDVVQHTIQIDSNLKRSTVSVIQSTPKPSKLTNKQQRMSTDGSSSNQPNVGMVNQPQPFQINN
jgi:hypothetical protein